VSTIFGQSDLEGHFAKGRHAYFESTQTS